MGRGSKNNRGNGRSGNEEGAKVIEGMEGRGGGTGRGAKVIEGMDGRGGGTGSKSNRGNGGSGSGDREQK